MQSLRHTAVPADDQELHLTRITRTKEQMGLCLSQILRIDAMQVGENLKEGRARTQPDQFLFWIPFGSDESLPLPAY